MVFDAFNKIKLVDEILLKPSQKLLDVFKSKYGKNGDDSSALSAKFIEIIENDSSLKKDGPTNQFMGRE